MPELLQLLIAIQDNADRSHVHELVQAGTDVNAAHDEVGAPLIFAAALGRLEIAEELLALGADPHGVHPANEMTALHCAAAEGHVEIARLLLNSNASMERRDNQGWTPMMFASQGGHGGIVELLRSAGATVDAEDEMGRTALFVAATNGRLDIAEKLILAGADANVVSGWATPLISAATAGHVDMAKLLIDHGADVNFLDLKEGYSALMMAAFSRHSGVVQLLLESGACVNRKTEWNVTALTMARRGQQREIEALLKAAGADEPDPVPMPIHFPWGWVGDPMLVVQLSQVRNDLAS